MPDQGEETGYYEATVYPSPEAGRWLGRLLERVLYKRERIVLTVREEVRGVIVNAEELRELDEIAGRVRGRKR